MGKSQSSSDCDSASDTSSGGSVVMPCLPRNEDLSSQRDMMAD